VRKLLVALAALGLATLSGCNDSSSYPGGSSDNYPTDSSYPTSTDGGYSGDGYSDEDYSTTESSPEPTYGPGHHNQRRPRLDYELPEREGRIRPEVPRYQPHLPPYEPHLPPLRVPRL
jgi:hypothetical protein